MTTMLKKFKAKLIHLLGGNTAEETLEFNESCVSIGQRIMANSILEEMERINGVDADQWCQHMYQSVKMRIEELF